MKELFKNVADKTDGIVTTRVGNSFVLGSVDNIVEAPVYSSSLIMAQTSVPFYQIVLRGYVNMSAEAMNLSSEVSELELKCAESGLSLYYQLMDCLLYTSLQNLDPSLVEAGAIDGIRNRFQELIYIILPQMGGSLMFGAVMQISQAFSVGGISSALVGFPSIDYAAHTIVLHISDFGNTRFELGYASALSVVLFAIMLSIKGIVNRPVSYTHLMGGAAFQKRGKEHFGRGYTLSA